MKATFRSEPKDYAEAMQRVAGGHVEQPQQHMNRAERRAHNRHMKNLTDKLVREGKLRRA